MNTDLSPDSSTADPWQAFLDILRDHPRVQPAARSHYARWVSQWQQGGGDVSAEATNHYFEDLGRRPGLQDWQFRQAVRAVELWCREVDRLAWTEAFDWSGLAAQADSLEPTHRTRRRESLPVLSSSAPTELGRDHLAVAGEDDAIDDLLREATRAIRLDR